MLLDPSSEILEQLSPEARVSHLSPAETQGHLDAIAIFDKALDLPSLGVEVVLVRLRAKANLFHEHDLLVLAGLPVLLLLLVLEATVVDQAGHRGDRRGGNFYEIEPARAGHGEGFLGGQDAELLAVLTDESYLGDPDLLVYPQVPTDCVPPILLSTLCSRTTDRCSVGTIRPSYATRRMGVKYSR
jgi:hypothetical protein